MYIVPDSNDADMYIVPDSNDPDMYIVPDSNDADMYIVPDSNDADMYMCKIKSLSSASQTTTKSSTVKLPRRHPDRFPKLQIGSAFQLHLIQNENGLQQKPN